MTTEHSLTDNNQTLAQFFTQCVNGFARERNVNATMLVEFGSVSLWIIIEEGCVTCVNDAPLPLSSWDFAVRARPDAWKRFWQVTPQPGSHDIFALTKRGEMRIEGNLYLFMCHLQYVKDLLATGRRGQ